jgi:pilus assembly protein CpaC
MKRQAIRWIPTLLVALAVWQSAYGQERIRIITGQQRRIPVPSGSQVSIGDPAIATAQATADQNQIILTGRSKGVTSLTILLPNGSVQERSIQVIQRDPQAVLRDIESAFGTIPGVQFNVNDNALIAKGVVNSLEDSRKLIQVMDLYPEITNLVDDISEKTMISIAISIVEVSRTHSTDYNNNPLPNVTLGLNNKTAENRAFLNPMWEWGANIDLLMDRIAYWVTTGQGKIVANPTLSVTEGDSAEFVSGGEVPFTFATRDGLAVQWKEYGIIIRIHPTILKSGNVMLNLEAEVSNVDYTRSANGIPSIMKRNAKTISIIGMGQTVVLAGIYQTSVSKSVKRVPVLGTLLPFLFKSVNQIEETKEIIICVTPNAPSAIKRSNYPMLDDVKR